VASNQVYLKKTIHGEDKSDQAMFEIRNVHAINVGINNKTKFHVLIIRKQHKTIN